MEAIDPADYAWGPQPLAAQFAAIVAEINRRVPRSDTYTVFCEDGPDGIILSTKRKGARVTSTTRPLFCDAHGGLRRIFFGTINDIKATNMTDGDALPCLVSPAAFYYADITLDEGEVDEWTVVSGSSIPATDLNESDSGHAYKMIASENLGTGDIANNLNGSLGLRVCGGVAVIW